MESKHHRDIIQFNVFSVDLVGILKTYNYGDSKTPSNLVNVIFAPLYSNALTKRLVGNRLWLQQ